MTTRRDAREQMLAGLRAAPAGCVPQRPPGPLLRPLRQDRHGLKEAFCEKFAQQTGIVYQKEPAEDIGALVSRIFSEHGLKSAIASCDSVLAAAGLPESAVARGIDIKTQSGFKDRETFTGAIFEKADAGLTGVDFGVAESGTLVLAFGRDHARLLSLAPETHIAVLPVERIVAVYEAAMAEIYRAGKEPSQAAWITGPSMTADIQGTPFKGMHGPRKLIVILV